LELDEMRAVLESAREGKPQGEPLEGGRGGTHKLVLPGGKRVFLRKYLRGGAASYLVKDLYLLRPERPFRELVVTETARAAGCPVPTVLAVSVEEVGLFYRGWIVTEAIDNARSMIATWFDSDVESRRELMIIIRADGSPVILDFDRGFFAPPATARFVDRGLDRLWRSMHKLSAAAGRALAEGERRWLEQGYRT
jgi:hypothetical protein